MQCKCGGVTKDHDVIKNHVTVAVYARCTSCGRTHWWQSGPATINESRIVTTYQNPLRWE